MTEAKLGEKRRQALLALGLKGAVLYRRKRSAEPWVVMAAFDCPGPAERYHALQDLREEWPWEYASVDLDEDDTLAAALDFVGLVDRAWKRSG